MKPQNRLNYCDTDLIRLIRMREDAACSLLINKLVPPLKRYLKSQGNRTKGKAVELACRVVVILILMKDEPVITASLLTYCIKIAKNQLSNESQKMQDISKPPFYFEGLQGDDDIYETIEKMERKLLVNRCLSYISEKCQLILKSFCDEIRAEQAAKGMGYRSERVYQVKKSECLKRLKKTIMGCPEFPELFSNI